jgi:chromosomal replication initiator protein
LSEEVAAEFGLAPEKIVSRSRMHEAALPRKVCLHLARQMTDLSLHTIGLHFNRDYTTVIFNLKAIAKLMNMNADLAHRVACLRAKLLTLRQS